MENGYRKVLYRFKGFVIFYAVWFALQVVLMIISESSTGLWPFSGETEILFNYGIVEFLFYLLLPLVILFLSVLINRKLYYRLF